MIARRVATPSRRMRHIVGTSLSKGSFAVVFVVFVVFIAPHPHLSTRANNSRISLDGRGLRGVLACRGSDRGSSGRVAVTPSSCLLPSVYARCQPSEQQEECKS